jgi:hypothetical protein
MASEHEIIRGFCIHGKQIPDENIKTIISWHQREPCIPRMFRDAVHLISLL